MAFKTFTKVIALTGDPGDASGSASFGTFSCRLQGVQIMYTGQPVTTDVVIKSRLAGQEKLILSLIDRNDDLPLQAVGESVLDDLGAPTSVLISPRLAGEILVEVSQGDADPAGVTVILLVE